MTMQTSELVAGQQTDALVALAQDWEVKPLLTSYWMERGSDKVIMPIDDYSPSTTRAQWAGLIEVFKLSPVYDESAWYVIGYRECGYSDTPGLAICKAVIAAKWGDEIPDEILEKVK